VHGTIAIMINAVYFISTDVFWSRRAFQVYSDST